MRCCKRRRVLRELKDPNPSAALDAESGLDGAVSELHRALRDLVDRRPAAELVLLAADINIEADRATAVHGLEVQKAFIANWHAWAIARIRTGGGREG